mmetsp:Transcript_101985/g.287903  ORF Transcript_101985/g.287903 Transcript_101985/m.287903 type:complete len:235 (+) Transcript_101985:793-1497(+)
MICNVRRATVDARFRALRGSWCGGGRQVRLDDRQFHEPEDLPQQIAPRASSRRIEGFRPSPTPKEHPAVGEEAAELLVDEVEKVFGHSEGAFGVKCNRWARAPALGVGLVRKSKTFNGDGHGRLRHEVAAEDALAVAQHLRLDQRRLCVVQLLSDRMVLEMQHCLFRLWCEVLPIAFHGVRVHCLLHNTLGHRMFGLDNRRPRRHRCLCSAGPPRGRHRNKSCCCERGQLLQKP